MSISTYAYAIVPPDQKWCQMKRVYDSCRKAGVRVPREVDEFFNFEEPCEEGARIDLDGHEAVSTYSDDDMQRGLTVEISKLPPHTKFVRFVNSW